VILSVLALVLGLLSITGLCVTELRRRSLARCDHSGKIWTGGTHLGPGTWCDRCMKILTLDGQEMP
jgi:uncharacterized iron-regulated membrane protein